VVGPRGGGQTAAPSIIKLIPLLREHISNIRQRTHAVYAGLAGLLSLRDRNLILAQLQVLREGFLEIGEQSGAAVNALDAVTRKEGGTL
jgi:hypothetical protein